MKRSAWALGGVVFFAVLSGCADRERSLIADGLLAVNVSELDFQRVALHNARELELVITNQGKGPIQLHDITADGPERTFEVITEHGAPHKLRFGDACRVRVRFAPKAGGPITGALVISSDDRAQSKSYVPLKGFGIDARAVISAPILDFGKIELESEKTLTISAHNPSEIPVDVRPEMLGTHVSEFSIQPFTLAPGEKRELPITFAPTVVGAKIVALAIAPCRGCADEVHNVRAVGLDRAVVAEPLELDFGQTPIDRTVEKNARLINLSTEPMTITSATLAASTDPSFSFLDAVFPVVLAGGETREWPLRYSPGHMGLAEGQLSYKVNSKRNPTTDVALRAFGGSPELCISPLNYDFGTVPVGSKIAVAINIKNCGSSNGDPLQLQELVFGGVGPRLPGEGQFHLAPGGAPLPHTLRAGEEVTVRAFFEPTQEGPAAATLNVRSTAFAGSHLKVGFSGRAQTHAPCQVAVTPGALDFGNVPPLRGAVLGVKIENRGTDLCAVKNIRLTDDGLGTFKLPGGNLDGFILTPGTFFSFMVAFNPLTAGRFVGGVQVEPADPANPRVVISLTGTAQTACLSPAPRYLDFGVTRKDCPAAPLTTSLLNACSVPIVLESMTIGAGTTDGEFRLTQTPATMPHVLLPGGAVSVEAEYLGDVLGMNLSPLFVRVAGQPAPLLIPLVGESSAKAEQTDRFVQQDGSKVDVLFVVDNTASMVEEHPKLVTALPTFVSEALARSVDLRVAVTTTGIETASGACPGGAEGGEAGRFFPVNNATPRILTNQMPNMAALLQANVNVGQCAFVEKGFEAVRRALSTPLVDSADDPRTAPGADGNLGFLRDEAALAVVFVGDEDDHSPDDVETYVRFLQSKKGVGQPQRATVYAIAPTSAVCATAGGTGTRYQDAAQRTGGEVMNICAPDYAPLMSALAAKAFSPTDRFPLTAQPDATSFEVTVNGAVSSTGWNYDATGNAIVFNPRPPAGARISIKYRKVCPTR